MLLNDAIFVLDEGLLALGKIREYELEEKVPHLNAAILSFSRGRLQCMREREREMCV